MKLLIFSDFEQELNLKNKIPLGSFPYVINEKIIKSNDFYKMDFNDYEIPLKHDYSFNCLNYNHLDDFEKFDNFFQKTFILPEPFQHLTFNFFEFFILEFYNQNCNYQNFLVKTKLYPKLFINVDLDKYYNDLNQLECDFKLYLNHIFDLDSFKLVLNVYLHYNTSQSNIPKNLNKLINLFIKQIYNKFIFILCFYFTIIKIECYCGGLSDNLDDLDKLVLKLPKEYENTYFNIHYKEKFKYSLLTFCRPMNRSDLISLDDNLVDLKILILVILIL
jgi:hypothetical protein